MALAILFIAIAIPRFFSLSLCWAAHQITSGRPAFYTFLDCQFRDLYFWPSALENETFSAAPFFDESLRGQSVQQLDGKTIAQQPAFFSSRQRD
jgi:hypothetical protein